MNYTKEEIRKALENCTSVRDVIDLAKVVKFLYVLGECAVGIREFAYQSNIKIRKLCKK